MEPIRFTEFVLLYFVPQAFPTGSLSFQGLAVGQNRLQVPICLVLLNVFRPPQGCLKGFGSHYDDASEVAAAQNTELPIVCE